MLVDHLLRHRARNVDALSDAGLLGNSMQPLATVIDHKSLDAFVASLGTKAWRERLAALAAVGLSQTLVGRYILQRHSIELTIERLRSRPLSRPPSVAERWIATYANSAVETLGQLSATGRAGLLAMLRAGLTDDKCLVAPFHLLRTAAMQRFRGFAVQFAAFEEGAPFDLLIERGGVEAEVACDIMSAEDGRDVHRGAWLRLMDRIDPELQSWLRANPGRYLLKMTLPKGLRTDVDNDLLEALHTRIIEMLKSRQHANGDDTAILRFDPLMLAAARADELGLMPRLRQEFGPEAHLCVTTASGGLFVMAARAGRENEVACVVRRRLNSVAPARLTGTRPGVLAMFIEDTDRSEWRLLRETLELERETRQFMTQPEAGSVVAVTCTTRLELFGLPAPEAEPEGELRFRNPAHPAAKTEALAPAVLSSQ